MGSCARAGEVHRVLVNVIGVSMLMVGVRAVKRGGGGRQGPFNKQVSVLLRIALITDAMFGD